MKSTAPSSNGHKVATSVFTPRPLPGHDVEGQIHRRGSSGSAKTHLDTRAFSDLAVNCAQLLQQNLQQRPIRPVDIDGINSRLLATRVSAAVQAHPTVLEASPDRLAQRLKLVQELYADRPSRFARQVAEQSQALVDDSIGAVVEKCRKETERAPFGVSRVLGQLEDAFSAITYPEPDVSAYTRFKNGVEAVELFEGQPDLLPSRPRERVVAALRKYATDSFERALAERCLDVCNRQLREAVDQVRSVLADIKGTVLRLRAAMETICDELGSKQAQSYRLHAVSASCNLLRLDGQDARELLAGLKTRLRVGSSAELVECLIERLVDRLNQMAEQRYPLITTPAGLTTLLSRIDPADTAETLEQLLRDLIGDSHSVYTSIRAYGVDRAVWELLERASPLCRLRSRNQPLFGVETAQMTVVRLPQPLGPEDQQTYRDVQDLFENEPNLKCIDAPPSERDVTVVRTIIGYPIAIDSNQETLLEFYATAESVRHLPHLFGVIPECQRGRPLDALKKLFETLDEGSHDDRW